MDVQGVSTSTVSIVNVQGLSLSDASIVDLQDETILFNCLQYEHAGCIPFYHQQYGREGCIPIPPSVSSVVVQDVPCIHLHRQQCGNAWFIILTRQQCGHAECVYPFPPPVEWTCMSIVQGISLSTTNSMDVHIVSIFTTISIDVQDVSTVFQSSAM